MKETMSSVFAAPLKGKTAVVTGACQGIGEGIALAFAREGANVVVNYRSHEDWAESVARRIKKVGRRTLAIKADVSRSDEVKSMISTVVQKFARIDILVNNAAAFLEPPVPLIDVNEADWDKLMDVNLKGVFLCSREVGRIMKKQGKGRIINISSLGAEVVLPGYSVYCATKAGIVALTKTLATELAKYGINVNAIAPGHIATRDNLDLLASNREIEKMYFERIPLGRLGRIEEIADLAVFLASDASSYVVGQTIFVDGGLMITQGLNNSTKQKSSGLIR